jgi:uncharacterized membrane protein YgcG
MDVRRRARVPTPLLPLCALALLLLPARGAATPNFPSAIRTELQLSYTPDCSLCHVGPQRVGTVNTPFGVSMRSRGLVFYDEASLRRALAALDAERIDSDRDGTPDIDELRAGGNPNVASGGGGGGADGGGGGADGGGGGGGGGGGEVPDVPPAPPTYGCSAGGASSTGLLLLAALALLATRASRSRWRPG